MSAPQTRDKRGSALCTRRLEQSSASIWSRSLSSAVDGWRAGHRRLTAAWRAAGRSSGLGRSIAVKRDSSQTGCVCSICSFTQARKGTKDRRRKETVPEIESRDEYVGNGDGGLRSSSLFFIYRHLTSVCLFYCTYLFCMYREHHRNDS